MLSHVDDSDMTEAEKNHWKAVGYFFHSFWYMELIDRFGDVPWIDKPLDETSEEAYGTRMPRLEVADKVLERLQWAEQNIGDATVRILSTVIVYVRLFHVSHFAKQLGANIMNWVVMTNTSMNVSVYRSC